MSFLFLYLYNKAYSFDGYFHLDLVNHFTKAGYPSMAYGPNIQEAYSNIMVQEYDKNITMEELHEKFPFTHIILLTQSRMFNQYRPPLVPPASKEIREDCWLPRDFNIFNKAKKILIDEDMHYEDNTDWIKSANIDLILQRHYSNVKRFKDIDKHNLRCFWHPFSVDVELFKPDNRERVNKIAMASSVSHEIYIWRKMLMDKLVPLELMEDYAEQRKIGNDYIETLKSYVATGCGSSIYDIGPAKMFEIMASGSLLFTDDNPKCGMYQLFDIKNMICYNRDGSDMIEKARWILNNPEEVKQMTLRARKEIEKKHSHEVRIKELVKIIEREL